MEIRALAVVGRRGNQSSVVQGQYKAEVESACDKKGAVDFLSNIWLSLISEKGKLKTGESRKGA
jgi:hypothetical protein